MVTICVFANSMEMQPGPRAHSRHLTASSLYVVAKSGVPKTLNSVEICGFVTDLILGTTPTPVLNIHPCLEKYSRSAEKTHY
jgi:hypothetical protein